MTEDEMNERLRHGQYVPPMRLFVTRDGVPIADQEQGIREFKAACRLTPDTHAICSPAYALAWALWGRSPAFADADRIVAAASEAGILLVRPELLENILPYVQFAKAHNVPNAAHYEEVIDGIVWGCAASVDTLPKGQDAKQGLAGTESGAVPEGQTPNMNRYRP